MLIDSPLNFPAGQLLAVFLETYLFDFKFGVAKVSFSKFNYSASLKLSDLRLAGIFRSPASAFQRKEIIRIKIIVPLVEYFSGNAEVSTGKAILRFLVKVRPFKPVSGVLG